MMKLQQRQALTSHFVSFWSIVYSQKQKYALIEIYDDL